MNILIVLPFSGRKFGGGLAVFNQELTSALAEKHSVKLVTVKLVKGKGQSAVDLTPTSEDHGGASIICINSEPLVVENPTGKDEEREALYEMINDPDLFDKYKGLLDKIIEDGWEPGLIIGHSRFSGPAAIQMKKRFQSAKVQYFLHSYPVEGTVLVGYDVYNEPIDTESAKRKLEMESRWMRQADVVVPVGPLLRAGALKLLGGAKVRIHECIGGAVASSTTASYTEPNGCLKLLFNGRATAPIKGLEDILLAARELGAHDDDLKVVIKVRYWETRSFFPGTPVDSQAVQEFAEGVLGEKSNVTVDIGGKSQDIVQEMRESHGVLSPSYLEHFGLVPQEALSLHVPVLITELSGAGMFLAQPRRFGTLGQACVVEDFYTRVSPSEPDVFLEPRNVPRDAFDGRPHAWADAIRNLLTNLEARFSDAAKLGGVLTKSYQWRHCAQAIVDSVSIGYEEYPVTQQGPDGVLWDAGCNEIS